MAASPTALPMANSPASAPQHLLRLEGVDGDDVLHADRADRLVGQVGHHLANLLEHSSDIGTGFGAESPPAGRPSASFAMMASAPSSTGTSTFCLWPMRVILPAGMRRSSMSPLGRLDHHGTARSHQSARNRHNLLGVLRVEVEEGGNVVGIAELLDGASGPATSMAAGIPTGTRSMYLHFIDDRYRLLQAVVDQHAIIFLHDRAGDGDAPRARRC